MVKKNTRAKKNSSNITDYILLKISGTKPLLSAGERKKEKIFQKRFGDIAKGSTFAVPIHAHSAEAASSLKCLAGLKKK